MHVDVERYQKIESHAAGDLGASEAGWVRERIQVGEDPQSLVLERADADSVV